MLLENQSKKDFATVFTTNYGAIVKDFIQVKKDVRKRIYLLRTFYETYLVVFWAVLGRFKNHLLFLLTLIIAHGTGGENNDKMIH